MCEGMLRQNVWISVGFCVPKCGQLRAPCGGDKVQWSAAAVHGGARGGPMHVLVT